MWKRRPYRRAVAIGVVLMASMAVPLAAQAAPAHTGNSACPWMGSDAPIDTRVAQVLAKMTLDEKITMVHGAAGSAYTGYIPGDSRLCIPALKMQDGPAGVRMNNTTQLPAAAAVAPAFDPSIAKSYGSGVGAQVKAKGVRVDPVPTAHILPESNPSCAMCSYSTINGTYACENAYLNNILKNDFGFQGFITSDWGGTHSTVASANAGLDMQMPDDSYFGAALKTAVEDGQV